MSSYASFYLKKDNNWIPLADYCRSTAIYEAISGEIPYGELIPIDYKKVSEIISNISSRVNTAQKLRDGYKELIESIYKCNNKLEEKMEVIGEYQGYMAEEDEAIEELNHAKSFYLVLDDILDSGELSKINDFLWAGIDACPPKEEEK